MPPNPIRHLRALTRYRKRLAQERAPALKRRQKVRESANIKLGTIATDLAGASGRALREALMADEQTSAAMAKLARGRMRSRIPALRQAREGRVTDHHRLLVRPMLTHRDFLDRASKQVQAQGARQLEPYEEAMTLVPTIPGMRATSAAAILAAIGVAMRPFPSAKHLASWAGLCPGNKQSGGKRMQAGTNSGNRWLRGVFGAVAWVVSHTQENDLVSQFQRIARRRGK
jgi:transposase